MSKSVFKIVLTLIGFCLLAADAFAVENSRFRFMLGLSGKVNEYNQTISGNKTDFVKLSGYSTTAGGMDFAYIFENGIGLGFGSGTVKLSDDAILPTEIAIGVGGIDLSYTLGESFNMTVGATVFGNSSLSSYKISGVEYKRLYESTSKLSQSVFLNLGFSLGENWELLLGQRNYDLAVKTVNSTDSTDVKEYDAKFSVYLLGFGYRFK